MNEHGSWRFGPFELDSVDRRLIRDGAEVALPPKAFDIHRSGEERRTSCKAGRFISDGLGRHRGRRRQPHQQRHGPPQGPRTYRYCFGSAAWLPVLLDNIGVCTPLGASPGVIPPSAELPLPPLDGIRSAFSGPFVVGDRMSRTSLPPGHGSDARAASLRSSAWIGTITASSSMWRFNAPLPSIPDWRAVINSSQWFSWTVGAPFLPSTVCCRSSKKNAQMPTSLPRSFKCAASAVYLKRL